MKTNAITLIASLIVLANACVKDSGLPLQVKKREFTTATGRVSEENTSAPVFNAMVILQECDCPTMYPILCPCPALDTVFTDSEGSFYFTFQQKEKDASAGGAHYRYQLRAVHEDCFPTDSASLAPHALATGIDNEEDIFLEPYAYVSFHFKNEPPAGENDQMSCYCGGELHPITFQGASTDTTVVGRVGSSKGRLRISGRIITGEIDSTYYDSLLVFPHDTVFHEILF